MNNVVVVHTNGVYMEQYTSEVIGSCVECIRQVEAIFGLDTSQELTKVVGSHNIQYKRGNTTYTLGRI